MMYEERILILNLMMRKRPSCKTVPDSDVDDAQFITDVNRRGYDFILAMLSDER